jgi:HEPN domain-containing protein
MDEAKRELVQKWLTIARRDLDSARILGTVSPPIYENALFHCQKAAEKAIKGFLISHDQRFSKTHELLPLVKLAEPFEPRFTPWRTTVDDLSDYAVELRYPETVFSVTRQDFDTALQTATDFYSFILSVLPTETHPTQ